MFVVSFIGFLDRDGKEMSAFFASCLQEREIEMMRRRRMVRKEGGVKAIFFFVDMGDGFGVGVGVGMNG